MAPPRRPMTPKRSDRTTHILCIGGANIDHVFEVDVLPTGEGKLAARTVRWGGGGVAGTAAACVSRLGARATWCGRIGDDWPGQLLKDMFDGLGVAVAAKSIVPGASTPVSSVFVNPVGERWIGYHEGDGLDVAGPSLAELPDMGTVDALAVTCVSDKLTADGLKDAARAGIPRVLDAESGTEPEVNPLARLANHVVFAEAGLASYTQIDDIDSALRLAEARLVGRTIGVTLGPRGSAWKTPTGVEWFKAPVVKARDTTGCGDVFHGAYALAIAEGADLHGAVRFATAAAAIKAERGGSWQGMPSRPDVEKLIQRGWN